MKKWFEGIKRGLWWIWKCVTFPFFLLWWILRWSITSVKQRFQKTPASTGGTEEKKSTVKTPRRSQGGSWPFYVILPTLIGGVYLMLTLSIGDSLSALSQNMMVSLSVLGPLLLIGVGAFYLLRKRKENPSKTKESGTKDKEEKDTKSQKAKDEEKPWWEKNSSVWLLFWTFYVVGLFTIFAMLAYTATRWIYHNIELEGMRNYTDYRNLVYMLLFIPFVANWWTVSNAKKLGTFSKGFAHVLWVSGIGSMFFTAFLFFT